MDRPGWNPGLRSEESATNNLSYGMTKDPHDFGNSPSETIFFIYVYKTKRGVNQINRKRMKIANS